MTTKNVDAVNVAHIFMHLNAQLDGFNDSVSLNFNYEELEEKI